MTKIAEVIRLADKTSLSIHEAGRVAGCGRSTIYKAINSGDLVARKMRSRTVILRTDLDRWLAALPVARKAGAGGKSDARGPLPV